MSGQSAVGRTITRGPAIGRHTTLPSDSDLDNGHHPQPLY
jgi:hypothetical protein